MEETLEQEVPARRRRRRAVALVAVVVVVGLAGSLTATAAVGQAEQRHASQLMDQHADEVARAVTAEATHSTAPPRSPDVT